MPTRTDYIAKMQLQLDKVNAKMGELETKAQEAREAARNSYKEEMTKLRHQSKLAVVKLEELKASSDDSWEGLVVDMEKMHDAFTHSFLSFFQIPVASWSHSAADKTVHKGK